MAVTIDEMQVNVEDRNTSAKTSAEPARPKQTPCIRRELDMLAERQLRLKGN